MLAVPDTFILLMQNT